MSRPKSVYLIRRDNVAFVCPSCPDRKKGEDWCINQDREILLDFCPKCAEEAAKKLHVKQKIERELNGGMRIFSKYSSHPIP